MPPRTLASASLALSFTLAACVITPVPIGPGLTPDHTTTPAARAPVPTPILDGERLTIGGSTAGTAPMVLEGAWVTRGDRHCIEGDTMRLVTAIGAIPFDDARLCVTLSPVSIEGEATVALPSLGFLAKAGLSAEGRRARIRFARGSELGTLDLAGHQLRTDPTHYYLSLASAEGFSATFGKGSFTTPGGAMEMVIDPQEPLVYVAGNLSLPGLAVAGAFGFSLAGRLGAHPVGLSPEARAVTGHILAAASVPIPGVPITVRGELLIDLDADDDGTTVLEGDDGDLAVIATGALSVGQDQGGFGFAIEVGAGSLWFDARHGFVEIAGETGGVFDGTPLAALAPARGAIKGHFRGVTNFGLEITGTTSVLGYATQQVRIALDPAGIHARLALALPASMGVVDLRGDASARGFMLSGTTNLTIAGLRLAAAQVSLGTSGVTVRGTITLPGLGALAVSGAVSARGEVNLAGRGTLTPFGLRLAGARVAVSNRGADIAGSVQFLGSRFAVRGTAANGHVSLAGSVALDLAVIKGKVALTIGDRGVRALVHARACIAGACLDLAGFEVDARGRVCPIFPVIGKQCIKIL